MNDNTDNDSKLKDQQAAALTVSVTVVAFFIVYWAVQIASTYNLLAMAYGW